MKKALLQVFSFDIISRVLTGLAGILLIRFMQPGEYAGYVLAFSAVTGLTGSLIASFNRVYIVGYETFNLGDSLAGFLGFQLLVISFPLLFVAPFMGLTKIFFWTIVLLVWATSFSEFSKTFFQQKLKFLSFSIVEISRSFLTLAGILFLIYIFRFNIKNWQVLTWQGVALLLVFLAVFGNKILVRGIFDFAKGASLAIQVMKGKYRFLFGYFFILAFFGQIDIFMLKIFSSSQQLATYGSAYRYYSFILIALSSVHNVLLPFLSKTKDAGEVSGIIRKNKRLLYIIIPVLFLGAYLARWILPFVDLGKYPQAVIVFQILTVSAIISLSFSPYVNILLCLEDFRFLFFLICLIWPIYTGSGYFLIPQWGAVGAALATLLAFGLVNFTIFLRAHRLLILADRG